ncbi:hypothetical protein ILUMI_15677 [Ignelater luminosus]|uniref:Uncharacterized protein n=1 Tax=Ignelater luminosus TaxID=2038154 RepID=A0A8K0CRS9_IGNLU|nr:hypothetical protein ILUMI_15677 [Ignelater luminosus]
MHQHEIIPNEGNIQLDGINTYIIDEHGFVINLETSCEPSDNNCDNIEATAASSSIASHDQNLGYILDDDSGDQTYEPSELISESSSSEAADTDIVKAENRTVNKQRGEPDKENNKNNAENNAQKKLSRKRPRNEKPRVVKAECSKTKCRLRSTAIIDERARLELFSSYWSIGDINRPRDFLTKHMEQVTTNSRLIRTTQSKFVDGFLDEDKRGKHCNHKKLDPVIRNRIWKHIGSIPRIELYHLRSQTSRKFIEGGKTLEQLHHDYMKTARRIICRVGTLLCIYSRLFRNEYNMSFFTPKKDQCSVYESYNNADEKTKLSLQTKQERHLKQKETSTMEKKNDKKKALENKCITVVFDLQAAFSLPKSEVSDFYYVSKLSMYNFTVFNLGTKEGLCYVWLKERLKEGQTKSELVFLTF